MEYLSVFYGHGWGRIMVWDCDQSKYKVKKEVYGISELQNPKCFLYLRVAIFVNCSWKTSTYWQMHSVCPYFLMKIVGFNNTQWCNRKYRKTFAQIIISITHFFLAFKHDSASSVPSVKWLKQILNLWIRWDIIISEIN